DSQHTQISNRNKTEQMEYAPFSVETCNEKVTSKCFYTHSMRYFYLLIILRLIKNKINKSNLKPKIEI
ncbi:hypothetical protein, partial [Vibrio parahaemolyticus]|uniref:hypothetical protein n=1 Tax=Vibrio parahaemolyticus TaxID=670 RepID=UPI001C5D8E98